MAIISKYVEQNTNYTHKKCTRNRLLYFYKYYRELKKNVLDIKNFTKLFNLGTCFLKKQIIKKSRAYIRYVHTIKY